MAAASEQYPPPPAGPQAAVTCLRPASPCTRPLPEPPLLCAPPRCPAKVIPARRPQHRPLPPVPPPPPSADPSAASLRQGEPGLFFFPPPDAQGAEGDAAPSLTRPTDQ